MKIDGTWYQRPEGVPQSLSAGGAIVRWINGQLHLALTREADYPDYILPKGTVEPGESLEQAAMREIQEEAGLTELILLGKLGVCERLDFEKRSWKITHYYLYYTHQSGERPSDARHAYRCEWFPIDRLPSMLWPEQKELIQRNLDQISKLALPFRQG